MAVRDTMRESVTPFLQPGETVQVVVGAQTASQYVAAFAGVLFFLPLNRYRVLAVTDRRIVVLDAGKFSFKKARAFVMELPRSTRLGPGSGIWHQVPAGAETLRVHRRFFKDMDTADSVAA